MPSDFVMRSPLPGRLRYWLHLPRAPILQGRVRSLPWHSPLVWRNGGLLNLDESNRRVNGS